MDWDLPLLFVFSLLATAAFMLLAAMYWCGRTRPYRVVYLQDAHYVVGQGRAIPCDSRADAEQTLAELLAPSSTSGGPRAEAN